MGRYNWIEYAADEHATKRYVDEEKKKDFIAGASWFANKLCSLMREEPMLSTASKSTKKMCAQAQIDHFWETIAEIEKVGRTHALRAGDKDES